MLGPGVTYVSPAYGNQLQGILENYDHNVKIISRYTSISNYILILTLKIVMPDIPVQEALQVSRHLHHGNHVAG